MNRDRLRAATDLLPAAVFITWAAFWATQGTFTEPLRVPDMGHIRYDETAGTATIPVLRVPVFGEVTVDGAWMYGCDGTTEVYTETFANGTLSEVSRWDDVRVCQDHRIDQHDLGQLLL